MKALLKFIAAMLGGGVIGLALVALIVWCIDGGNAIKTLTEHKEVNALNLALSMAGSLVAMVVAIVLHIALHEVGHLLGGLATGFRFVCIRLLQFTFVKEQGRLRMKKFAIQGTGGQCIMTLPEDTDPNHVPYFWYNAGGVVINLLLVVLSLVLLINFEWAKWADALLVQMAFVGIFFVLINGLPISMSGMNTDGQNIFLLRRSADEQRYFMHLTQIAAALCEGRRYKEMPKEWFEENRPQAANEYFALANRFNYIARLEDDGRFEEALSACEELQAWDDKRLPRYLRMELSAEQITLELLTSARKEVIEKLWTPQLQKYVEAGSRYSTSKMVTRLGIALLYNNDEKLAASLSQELCEKNKEYLMSGEVATSVYLANCLKEIK